MNWKKKTVKAFVTPRHWKSEVGYFLSNIIFRFFPYAQDTYLCRECHSACVAKFYEYTKNKWGKKVIYKHFYCRKCGKEYHYKFQELTVKKLIRK